MNSDVQYLYCISEDGSEDFITISYTFVNNLITIFNFNKQFNIKIIKYVAIDYTSDPFVSFNKKWTNSNALSFYKVSFLEEDIDRMTVTILVSENINHLDLQSYKRDSKIENIINE